MKVIQRTIVSVLEKHLHGSVSIPQIVIGPRQVGKTTAVQQVRERWKGDSLYASADLPSPPDAYWIQSQWQAARQKAKTGRHPTLLILDEIQKIERWAEPVKALVDEDRRTRARLRIVLLGSSSLHIQKGAQESLAGRFELHFCSHWTWPECRKAFGWDLNQWIYYGGYPGAAPFIRQPDRWAAYVSSSLIEAVLSRDVLQMASISKPALLRQLFMLAAHQPAQILSYNKMLGQLQDAGNTVTLSHYVRLLSSAFLLSGLNQWRGGLLREKASSPKLILWNNALVNAVSSVDYAAARHNGGYWGHLVENAVGAHLLNGLPTESLFYWREDNQEVDFVVQKGSQTTAIEVKSGQFRTRSGLDAFHKRYTKSKTLIIGQEGVTLEQFFEADPSDWF